MGIHDWTKVDAGIFQHFQLIWYAEISKLLNSGRLPPWLYALIESDDRTATQDKRKSGDESGGVILQDSPPVVRFRDRVEAHYPRRSRLQIVVRNITNHHAIAVLDIVSPFDKDSRKRNRRLTEKWVSLLNANIHLFVIDLLPNSPNYPEGINSAIWQDLTGAMFSPPLVEKLSLASYSAATVPELFLEPIAVGDELPAMPLFLSPEKYINVPLAESYDAAWSQAPAFYQDILASRQL